MPDSHSRIINGRKMTESACFTVLGDFLPPLDNTAQSAIIKTESNACKSHHFYAKWWDFGKHAMGREVS